MSFHEVQHVHEWWVWAIVLGVSLPILGVAVYLAHLAARKITGGARVLVGVAAAMTFLIGALTPGFLGLLEQTTEVREDGLHVEFWPLPSFHVRISCERIRSMRVRTYDPLGEYGGWGIRRGSGGGAYNMTGNRGLQLELEDGEHLLIGSQRPEELAEAIEHICPGG